MNKVLTFGCFDIFHVGHLNLLRNAKKLGDVLIVGIPSDYAIIIEPKKNGAPAMTSEERLRIIQSIDCVDLAFVYAENKDLEKSIEVIRPDVICRGDDWHDYPGKKMADKLKIKTVYLPHTDGISSTLIKEQCGHKKCK
jgi:glycerol-3-phosphate cytidylyltransferase